MPNEKKRTWRHFSITRWIKWTLVLFLAMAVTTIVDMIDPVEPGKPLFEVSSTLRRFFCRNNYGIGLHYFY